MIRVCIILIMGLFISVAQASGTFTPEQKKQIGKISADYLVQHPDFLLKASKKLQEQQMKKQQESFAKIVAGQSPLGKKVPKQLLQDKQTPFKGPANASVAVIEFFDYQCLFCSKVNPAFEALEKKNSHIKFIFKDYPIFGSQWAPSNYAANVGMLAFRQGGSQLYMKYHNRIFDSNKYEGKLQDSDIKKIAEDLHIDLSDAHSSITSKLLPSIQQNMTLGKQLEIMGTPFIIVMPVEGANVDNITVFSGYPANPQAGTKAAVDALQKAIDKAGKSGK